MTPSIDPSSQPMYPPQNASAHPTSSPATFPLPPDPQFPHRSLPLTVQPNATVPPRGSTILTPPPSAHPKSQSSSSFSQHHPPVSSSSSTQTLPPPPNHVPVALAHGVNASIQPATRLLNRQHVPSSSYPQQPPQQQQQQVLNQENGVVHAQRAPLPWHPAPPQVVAERTPPTPKLRPATFPPGHQQPQQQQQKMTHSTATTTATTKPMSSLVRVRPNGAEPYPVQASTRGQQPVKPAVASAVPSALAMQTRPQRVMQPHTQMPERIQKPTPSTQAQQQQQQQQQQQRQQQQQQDAHIPSPAIAAFRVLQPVKALLEQTWSTSMDAVQREFAELNAELIRSGHEQQRLAEMLQRCQAERTHALRALHETKAMLRDSKCFLSSVGGFC